MIAVDTLLQLDERAVVAAAVHVGLRMLAQYLGYVVPIATFCAAFVCVSQGARSHEIVALKAGGVNPLVALIPIFAASLAIGIAFAFVQETVGVRAAAMLSEQAGELHGLVTHSGLSWKQAGRVIYGARDSDPEDERVMDIHVLERDSKGRLLRQIQAERAVRLGPQQWRFEQAVVRSFDPSQPTMPPRFERSAEVTLELAADPTPRLEASELAALPLPLLGDYVSSVLTVGRPGPARAAFHQRASAPGVPLLFALLAIPLALSLEGGGGIAFRALLGVLWVAGFLFLRILAGTFGKSGGAAAVWMPWSLLGIFLSVASLRLARTPR